MATDFMGLTLPVVSQTLGPLWASQLNTALTSVDAHDHTSGKGKLVPAAGLNINADLSFANNSATLLKSVQLNDNASTLAILRSIYASGGDLWYTNSSGNTVQITNGGAVNAGAGSITGLSSPASAAYNSGTATFLWSSAVNSLASMSMGAVVLHASTNPTLNSISIQAPAVLAAPYNITLPDAVPTGAGGFLMMRATGAQGYAYPDNSTIEESPVGIIKVKKITGANLDIYTTYDYIGSGYVINPITPFQILQRGLTLPQGAVTISIQPTGTASAPTSSSNRFLIKAYSIVNDTVQLYFKVDFPTVTTKYYTVTREVSSSGDKVFFDPFSISIPVPVGGSFFVTCLVKCYNANTTVELYGCEMVIKSS